MAFYSASRNPLLFVFVFLLILSALITAAPIGDIAPGTVKKVKSQLESVRSSAVHPPFNRQIPEIVPGTTMKAKNQLEETQNGHELDVSKFNDQVIPQGIVNDRRLNRFPAGRTPITSLPDQHRPVVIHTPRSSSLSPETFAHLKDGHYSLPDLAVHNGKSPGGPRSSSLSPESFDHLKDGHSSLPADFAIHPAVAEAAS